MHNQSLGSNHNGIIKETYSLGSINEQQADKGIPQDQVD